MTVLVPIQMLNVIVKAPDTPGPLEEVFTVTVADQSPAGKKLVEFKLTGKVLPGDANTLKDGTEPQRVTTAKPPVPPAP